MKHMKKVMHHLKKAHDHMMHHESKEMAHEHEAKAGRKVNKMKKHHMAEARGMKKAMRHK